MSLLAGGSTLQRRTQAAAPLHGGPEICSPALLFLGYRLGAAGAILGLLAGGMQWAFGDDIPEWTGNKLHPIRLGILTIVLSLISLACVRYLDGHRNGPTRQRLLAGSTAGICFTTVGRLWYVPGPLLLVSLALLLRR